ncbi:MAG: LuxR C-terminal-related transcriptional regulator [Bacteroidales bacterium]|nr:LuxR C-terminal-related transcriptional regulator [Bacteroidales bacterium]MCF8454371.1 LuxR C-terminal-related transcriptional regulator [Bacteroidales bacterium]
MKPILNIVFLSLTVFCFSLQGQIKQIGNPFITNYNKSDIQAGAQNYAAVQDDMGRMYFGNNTGVLVYNGNTWKLVPVDNKSYVRSLAIDSANRVYVGAYQEFGYLDHDSLGNLKYESLLHLVPEECENFADIWKIVEINNTIYFQSYYYIFEYKEGEMKILRPENEFIFSFNINNELYVGDKTIGLKNLKTDSFILVENGHFFASKEIRSMLPFMSNSMLIGTRKDGVFVYDNGEIKEWNPILNDELTTHKLNCGVKIDDKRFAFGTVQNGVVITDGDGEIIMNLSTEQGIQDNAIENLFSDMNKNLWIVHYIGIDYAEISSAYNILSTGIGSGYASMLHGDNLYLGTNRGLYHANWRELGQVNKNSFKLIPNTVGQVWCLYDYKGLVLLGHHEGAFIIKDQKARKVSDVNGNWQFLEMEANPGYILAGTYTGYILFKEENQDIRFVRKIDGFNESCRVSLIDKDGYIWMSHGWKGIFRLKLNPEMDGYEEVDFFSTKDGLPSDLYNDIFMYHSQVYISAIDGIYVYDKASNRMEKDSWMTSFFNFDQPLSKVIEAPDKSIWNLGEGRVGRLTILNDTIFLNDYLTMSFIKDKLIPPFESLNWYDKENMIIGTQNGFIHFQPSKENEQKTTFGTEIYSFEAIGNNLQIRLGGELLRGSKPFPEIEIPYKNNLIRVGVSANFFSNPGGTQYKYSLDGFSSDWSAWFSNPLIEFARLKEGSYNLHVKSRNYKQEEGSKVQFRFVVLPPWYRSLLAYFGFAILFLLIIGLTYFLINRRIERLKKLMALKQQREIEQKEKKIQEEREKTEKELIGLRNEKLRDEVIHKSKELANSANSIIHKNQVLNEIKADLKLMAEESKNLFVQRKIKGLLRKIDKDIEDDQGHEIFRSNFDRVHENFIAQIRKAHPDLTPKDLQMVSYLRMNMSTKEIAPMLNISVRGVEISRYRLRKKLGLQHDHNLTDYILNIS